MKHLVIQGLGAWVRWSVSSAVQRVLLGYVSLEVFACIHIVAAAGAGTLHHEVVPYERSVSQSPAPLPP